jgi:hypothetical protein
MLAPGHRFTQLTVLTLWSATRFLRCNEHLPDIINNPYGAGGGNLKSVTLPEIRFGTLTDNE